MTTSARPDRWEASYSKTYGVVVRQTALNIARRLEQQGHKYHTVAQEGIIMDIITDDMPRLSRWWQFWREETDKAAEREASRA